MEAPAEPATPAEAEWLASQRQWSRGWRRLIFPGALLIYLLYVAGAVGQFSHGAAAIWGYAILVAFAGCYLAAVADALPEPSQADPRRFWTLYGVLVALFAAELPLARAAAFVLFLYITILTVGRLGRRSLPLVAAMALASLLVPVAIPSWHDGIGKAFGTVTPVAIPVVALGVFGMVRVHRGNRALAEARAQLAALAAENERIRIARDLHDLLGHSLTTITVKAGLARRLGGADPAGALRQIADVETLSRRTLADVRAAVTSYRDVTLAGELATGRELLRAAGIIADLPRAVDVADPGHHELFGWAVREGLTNVVRHSRASSCAVRLSACSVEIVDDGIGGGVRGTAGPGSTGPGNNASRESHEAPGNGLSGLRERVAAAGGSLDAGPLQPRGWRLRVSLTPDAGP